MINVAQIGVGYWGPNLLRNLVANEDCNVRMVADISAGRRNYINKYYPGLQTTGNCEAVIEDTSIDAVVIATPVKSHYELTLKALNAGKHVLVEKPMARMIEEIKDIQKVSEQKKLVAMVGHTFLYNTAVRYLKDYTQTGKLGDIRYIYAQRLNLGRVRSDVDVLWNLAPHDISIFQYLLDDLVPISITSRGMDYIQKGINDVVFMDIIYPGKIIAHIHVSWLDPNKVRKIIVVGSQKMVIYDDVADNKIAIFDKGIDVVAELGKNMHYDERSNYILNHRSGNIVLPKIQFEEPLKIEIEHFMDCIKNGTKCLTGPEHALGVVRILSGEI